MALHLVVQLADFGLTREQAAPKAKKLRLFVRAVA